MKQYKGATDAADLVAVFYSEHALELKRMPPLPPEKVKQGFEKSNLQVFTKREDLENWLKHHEYSNTSLVFMSSGTYDGMDILKVLTNK